MSEWQPISTAPDGVVVETKIDDRGMKGVYQHCGEQHLNLYLSEFDFRQNTRAKLGIEANDNASQRIQKSKAQY